MITTKTKALQLPQFLTQMAVFFFEVCGKVQSNDIDKNDNNNNENKCDNNDNNNDNKDTKFHIF